jgi:hypothetical protein
MNEALRTAAASLQLMAPEQTKLRLAFGLACAERIAHLLEDPRARTGLAALRAYLDGRASEASLDAAREELASLARSHPGSKSLDGAAHAAVSATHAVSSALAGRALEAADYASYAAVYAYGSYAVAEPTAYDAEFQWQLEELTRLASG